MKPQPGVTFKKEGCRPIAMVGTEIDGQDINTHEAHQDTRVSHDEFREALHSSLCLCLGVRLLFNWERDSCAINGHIGLGSYILL